MQPETEVPVPTEDNPFRDVTYIAKVTGFKPATVRSWLREERLKGFMVAGEWRVMHSEFVAFLKKEYG
jgi:hypothetical protein